MISKFEHLEGKRERSKALQLGVTKANFTESRPRELAKNYAKKTQVSRTERTRRDVGYQANNNEVFVPDMVDYEKVIRSGLARLKNKKYDSWSMLVRLCFDNSLSAKKNDGDKKRGARANVNPLELMRFHPVLNKLDMRTVKLLLDDTKLCKLNPNTLLYAHNEVNKNWYLILFGTLVLHHEVLGALGVLSMEHTAGEESIVSGVSRKIDAAYAQTETYLLEMSLDRWRELKQHLMGTG